MQDGGGGKFLISTVAVVVDWTYPGGWGGGNVGVGSGGGWGIVVWDTLLG